MVKKINNRWVVKIIIVLLLLILYLIYRKSSFGLTDINRIPKILMQTYKDKSKVPGYIFDNIKKYCSDYEYHFFDESNVITFLKDNYTNEVLEKFNNLKSGAHKADLFRYCWLYINGGVYLDIKTILIKKLNEIFDHSIQDVKHQLYTVNSINSHTIYQGILASTPKNPIFKDLIDKIIPDEINNSEYIILTRQFYEVLQKYKDSQIIKLFDENCITNYEDKSKIDRYGYYCTVLDNKETLFETRDPNYKPY